MSAVVIEEKLKIPLGIRSLRDFRKWFYSPTFPERGRIDYIGGDIEVEMSPEQIFSHGGPKEAIARTLGMLNFQLKKGYLRIDNIRVTCVAAKLSAEPDLIYFSKAKVESQEIVLTTSSSDSYLEITGGPDVVIEIVSDSSVAKDTRRLPAAYFAANVTEYWLIDARDADELTFHIHRRGKTGFQRVRPDADGFQKSKVFERSFQLLCKQDDIGLWEFELRMH